MILVDTGPIVAVINDRDDHHRECSFATVITMLWWLHPQSIVTLLGAQRNVVLKQRLYPRTLVDAPATKPGSSGLRHLPKERI